MTIKAFSDFLNFTSKPPAEVDTLSDADYAAYDAQRAEAHSKAIDELYPAKPEPEQWNRHITGTEYMKLSDAERTEWNRNWFKWACGEFTDKYLAGDYEYVDSRQRFEYGE